MRLRFMVSIWLVFVCCGLIGVFAALHKTGAFLACLLISMINAYILAASIVDYAEDYHHAKCLELLDKLNKTEEINP